MADFAKVWQAADKVVYSTTLQAASTARTRLERSFDPDSVRDMKRSATSDLTVGGANLAAHAFKGGLVDECQLLIHPVVVGGGKPAFPTDARAELELVDELAAFTRPASSYRRLPSSPTLRQSLGDTSFSACDSA